MKRELTNFVEITLFIEHKTRATAPFPTRFFVVCLPPPQSLLLSLPSLTSGASIAYNDHLYSPHLPFAPQRAKLALIFNLRLSSIHQQQNRTDSTREGDRGSNLILSSFFHTFGHPGNLQKLKEKERRRRGKGKGQSMGDGRGGENASY